MQLCMYVYVYVYVCARNWPGRDTERRARQYQHCRRQHTRQTVEAEASAVLGRIMLLVGIYKWTAANEN